MPLPCPCCGFRHGLRPFQSRFDHNGTPTRIQTCLVCGSLSNALSLEHAERDPDGWNAREAQHSQDTYGLAEARAQIAVAVPSHTRTLQWLRETARRPFGSARAMDFGAGSGLFAAAACASLEPVWAVELNLWTMQQLAPEFGVGDRLTIVPSLDEVPDGLDLIISWHCLEHIPNLHEVGQLLERKLAPGGVFFWQVPMYRDPYVIPSHVVFLNEFSAGVFSERIGLECESVWHDEGNQFLTCIARKPG